MNTQPTAEFLTADELARVLRISKATVYARVRSRQFPHYKIGDRVVFKLAEVLAATRVPTDDDFTIRKIGAAVGR
jgi:excisionase family DNA binding protein